MAFPIVDFMDLLELLRERPEWKAELRRELLGDELISLPDLVRANSEAIAQNSADIRELREVVAQNSADIRELQAATQTLVVAIDEFGANTNERLQQIWGTLGGMSGDLAEMKWAQGFSGRFGRLISRAHIVLPGDLERFQQAAENEDISEDEYQSVLNLDLVIEGRLGPKRQTVPGLLAVEVSAKVEASDIRRAAERAAILRKVGYTTIAVAAGAIAADESIASSAAALDVVLLLKPSDIHDLDRHVAWLKGPARSTAPESAA
jgi:hypothetical protein